MNQESPIFEEIRNAVTNNDVALFMKGNKSFPQCGFSSAVVHVLQTLNVDFADYNVLDSMELREAIKIFSDWPTIPQLYVKGEFIGGCDIIREMTESGELQSLFNEKGISYSAPQDAAL